MQITPHTNQPTTARSSRGFTRTILTTALALAAFAPGVRAERAYFAWGVPFDPAANFSQNGVAVAMDRRGNVAATGYTFSNGDEIYYTAKYDALTGALLWGKTFDAGFGGNRPASVACDSQGNVIVTGRSNGNGTNFDYLTIKYSAATGQVLWTARYNNTNNGTNGEDRAVKVAVDFNNDVIVTGSSIDQGKQEDFYTIKYNGFNGVKIWEQRYNSAGNYSDKPTDMFVDASGNVAVTGVSRVGANTCFYTAKYNGSNGAVIWDKTYDGAGGKDDTGRGVAIDGDGNVLVTGTEINSNGTYAFKTIKYSAAAGTVLWSRLFNSPDSSYYDPAGLVVDSDGNVFVSGSSRPDNFKVTFYTVKYAALNGATLWEKTTDAPGDEDLVTAIGIDGAGNPVVTGSSEDEDFDADFYTIKYNGADGSKLWDRRLKGESDSGDDIPRGLAVDAVGNVAVTGTGKKASPSPYFEMLTAKFNRFLLAPGDPITGPGLTSAAVVSAFNVPALGDTAALGAKVTVKDGKKTYSAILTQGNGNGNRALALQTETAPDVAVGTFKSFNDPVIAPNGRVAFFAKLSGAPGAEAAGVWTDAFTGSLQCALQYNKQVPGMAPGVVLKSVSSISLRNGQLAALITVKGGDTTSKNTTVFINLVSKNTGYVLARTDAQVNADNVMSNIKKLSVYTPPKTSPGQGRYHGDNRLVATATLVDKRTAILLCSPTGGFAPLAATKGGADNLVSGAKWKSFGPPSTGTNGFYYSALATLAPKEGGITSKDDTAIVYSVLGGAFDNVAVEGEPAPDSNGGNYLSFNDPVSNNQGCYAFLGKAKGGDFGTGKLGLWYGQVGALQLVARSGGTAPDAIGNAGPSTFNTIKNIALPGGVGSGPIFLATVKGGGASGKNNFGLWGMDSDGFTRQLLRNGDVLGDQTVKKFVLLNSLPGCFSANRSFNAAGGIAALVSFTDKTNAVVYVGIP
jgi:hypothetical protein